MILGLTTFTQPVKAQQRRQEAVPQELREYDVDKLRQLKGSGDFDYVEGQTETPSILRRIWNFLIDLIDTIFSAATGNPIGKALLYVCGFILLMVAIIKLLGINPRDVFYGASKKAETDLEFLEENIHDLDFDKLLTEALSKEDYRLAVRLTYLKTLKLLSDHGLVDWEPGKTNYEYLYELRQKDLRDSFGTLSYHFDYAWYGDFEIDERIYNLSMAEATKITRNARKPAEGQVA